MTGDDCVSVGTGCYNVDMKNITCLQGHGISIGSLGKHNSGAWVSNITIRDTTIKQTKNGVRIKTWQGGYGAVIGVKYDNILMENVRKPHHNRPVLLPNKTLLEPYIRGDGCRVSSTGT
ncbi:hypothetical protein R6Q57_018963 [Mikania cordata]